MARPSALLLSLLCCAAPLGAQVATTAKSIVVPVMVTEPWTDSGLDLKAGDTVRISATAPQETASRTLTCDPKGLAGAPDDTAALPLPTAAPGALLARLHSQGSAPLLVGALQKANKVKTLTHYLPQDAVQEARNATGDGYHSDGKVLVIFLQ